ncbi:MAG: hypothetical protein ACK4GQ_05175, partial [Candidatus Hadarchaeales archaeon]
KTAESLSEDYRRISKLIREHIDELFLFLEGLELPHSTNGVEGEIKPYANVRGKSPNNVRKIFWVSFLSLISAYYKIWKQILCV